MPKIGFRCDGCGKMEFAWTLEELLKLTTEWLRTPEDWGRRNDSTFFACSADCVAAARKAAKKRARERLARLEERIDQVVLERAVDGG